MDGLPEQLLLWLRAMGEIRNYSAGQCIIPPKRSGPPGISIVLSGLVRVQVNRGGDSSSSSQHFVGVGGLLGFVSTMLNQVAMPGLELVAAYAQGNALGGGPVVLYLPPRVLLDIRQKAAGIGCTAAVAGQYNHLLVNMYRQAGLLVFDRMREGALRRMVEHLEQLLEILYHKHAAHSTVTGTADHRRLQHQLELLMAPVITAQRKASAAAAAGGSSGSRESVPLALQQTSSLAPLVHAAAAAGAAVAAGDAAAGSGGDGDRIGGGVGAVWAALPVDSGALELLTERGVLAVAGMREALHNATVITLRPGETLTQCSVSLPFIWEIASHLVQPGPSPCHAIILPVSYHKSVVYIGQLGPGHLAICEGTEWSKVLTTALPDATTQVVDSYVPSKLPPPERVGEPASRVVLLQHQDFLPSKLGQANSSGQATHT